MHRQMRRDVPKTMPKSEMEMLLSELKELRRTAGMGNASFGSQETTDEIRQKTEVWRGSWIIDPLSRLIKRYETGKRYNPYEEATQ